MIYVCIKEMNAACLGEARSNQMIMKLVPFPFDCKKQQRSGRRTAVRERHHEDPIECSPETPRTSRHYIVLRCLMGGPCLESPIMPTGATADVSSSSPCGRK